MLCLSGFELYSRWVPLCYDKMDLSPLSPKSDQRQISPCNIDALLNSVVMRITDMITQDEFARHFINFSLLLL